MYASSWEVTQRLLHPKSQQPRPGKALQPAMEAGGGLHGDAVLYDHPTITAVGGQSGDSGETQPPARGCRRHLPLTFSLPPASHLLDDVSGITNQMQLAQKRVPHAGRCHLGVSAPEGEAVSDRLRSVR